MKLFTVENNISTNRKNKCKHVTNKRTVNKKKTKDDRIYYKKQYKIYLNNLQQVFEYNAHLLVSEPCQSLEINQCFESMSLMSNTYRTVVHKQKTIVIATSNTNNCYTQFLFKNKLYHKMRNKYPELHHHQLPRLGSRIGDSKCCVRWPDFVI